MATVNFPSYIAGGFNWKILLFLNLRNSGFEDVWYYNNTVPDADTGAAWTDAILAAKTLAQERQKLISPGTEIMGARVTALDDTGQMLGTNGASVPLLPRDLSLPAFVQTTAVISPDVSVQFLGRTSPPGVQRIWQSRGWASGPLSADPAPGFSTGVGATVDGYVQPFVSKIIQKVAAPFVGTFCMRGRVRVDVLAPSLPAILGTRKYPIVAVSANNTTRRFVFTIATPTPDPLEAGVKIIVAKTRLKCGKGANGAQTILSVDTTTQPGFSIISTNQPWNCGGAPVYNSFGYLYCEQFGLYTISRLAARRIGNRQTGKPNFTTAGRRQAQAI